MGIELGVIMTAKQWKVAEMCASGETAEEIAKEMGISVSTTRAHIDVVKRKLGVSRKRHIHAALVALEAQEQAE
jgi:DNA-binding NarL/FixJ family response regulator